MTRPPAERIGKTCGYITAADRLLVFREPDFPDVGLQVPGGTLEYGETPEQGIVRELTEETGRSDFVVHGLIGRHTFARDENGVRHIHDRHYFHVTPATAWPATWRNLERTPHSGVPPVMFEFFWLPLANPKLALGARLDEALAALRDKLGIAA